jgi:CrcB protein
VPTIDSPIDHRWHRSVVRALTSEGARRVVAIGSGGALGTLTRYGTERVLAAASHGFPWGTFTANVAGAFVLGAVVTLVLERWPPTRYVRPFAAVGFCGGFTTFSTFVVEADRRAWDGHAGLAATYVVASLAAGLVAVTAGVALARVGGPRWRKDDPGTPGTDTPVHQPAMPLGTAERTKR